PSRLSLSMRWRNGRFTNRCGHRCGARLLFSKRTCQTCRMRFERKQNKFSPPSRKFSRVKNGFSTVAPMLRKSGFTAIIISAMRTEDVPFLERWADLWYRQMSSVFLQSYLKTAAGAIFIPQNPDDLQIMLQAYLLDKAVYEIGYELNHRPDWVVIPVRGIKHI